MAEAEDSEIKAPLVFFCSGCRSIFGDSLSFLFADEGMGTITLSSVVAVTVDFQSPKTSQPPETSAGCTYFEASCGVCKSGLGRLYNSTTRNFDRFRDNYTLDLDKVSSYALGSAASEQPGQAVSVPTMESAIQGVEQVKEQVLKVQACMLAFNDRIQKLESQAGIKPEGGKDPSENPSAGSTSRKKPRRSLSE